MTLEQKCAILSGTDVFCSRDTKDVPSIWLSNSPMGLRKQAGESNHLSLNPSVEATCFPTATNHHQQLGRDTGREIGRALGEGSH